MKTVWKYEVALEHKFSLEMPVGAEIVHFERQGKRQEDPAFIWCIVDTEQPLEQRNFVLVGTGEEFPHNYYRYIGTILIMNGGYVLHLLEIYKRKE